MLLSTIAFSFKADHSSKRHYFTAHLKTNPSETISGYTSTITGNDGIEVIFDRTGPDAGVYPVSIDFDVSYEGTVNATQTYTLDLSTNIHTDTYIRGSGTVMDATMGDITPTYY